jgi:hypothetical protein
MYMTTEVIPSININQKIKTSLLIYNCITKLFIHSSASFVPVMKNSSLMNELLYENPSSNIKPKKRQAQLLCFESLLCVLFFFHQQIRLFITISKKGFN